MELNDIISEPSRIKIFDIILDEACRQWCCFIDEDPGRADGEGFAEFFYDIFRDKELEYMKDLGIEPPQDKPSILRNLAEKKAEISSKPAPAPDKEHKTPEAAL